MTKTRPTDTSERELEALIVRYLTGQPAAPDTSGRAAQTPPAPALVTGGYVEGHPHDYLRDVGVDVKQLLVFLQATDPAVVEQLGLAQEGPQRSQFLHRLQGEITKRGVVNVLRKGVSRGPAHVDLYKFLPTPGNPAAAENFERNVFSVTRQLRYSNDETLRSLDLVIFINGLPVATFELKNSLTTQTVSDAVTQYQHNRDPRELLFHMGRCIVHFAVDDSEVAFCTQLAGKASWFLPFNQGWNSGAGNPPNPQGLKTDYLWRQVLTRFSLANIVENFAQVVEEEDEGGRKKRRQVFPRYHQLRTVRALLRRTQEDGVGRRYLIQHSAGSGKSNTIAWLAHQLVELKTAGDAMKAQFDSVIVITDRRALDTQISRTIKSFDHVAAIFGHSDKAEDLRRFLRQGKKIIVTTVQKFPFILDELGGLGSKRFALLIDEAHSSQGGKTTAKMHLALAGTDDLDTFSEGEASDDAEVDPITQETVEDKINQLIESRAMLSNASYFAFTATPKNRTLELFGQRHEEGGEVCFRAPAELTYTTKQAIEEGFIVDVTKNYTPVDSFYHVAKRVEDDPQFDKVRALKKIRHYVESHEKAIQAKAVIMVNHFMSDVVARRKIGGQARAMIVCQGVARAVDYFSYISRYLSKIKSPYKAIVAYSGDVDMGGVKKTEADLNGFPSKDIPARFKQEPYRFLIVANKFVTGFDEPLLHTMYVDKSLAGVQAVQTLSRLNRAHPQKKDTFVLDFADNAEAVKKAFQDYYRATVQKGETDPDKLHDLKNELDALQVYAWPQVEQLVTLFLTGAERNQLDPILDICVAAYLRDLNEDQQVEFKGKAKSFLRSYGFLGAILTYGHPAWEKLSIFLNFLVRKLPAPKEEDFSKGVLDTIDMDSYRPEMKAALSLAMDDADGELEPAPTGGGGGKSEPEIDRLSNIIKTFNDLFGNIDWKDGDKIRRVITEEIPQRVAQDKAYQNAQKHADLEGARMEHDRALSRVVHELLSDHMELFKQFSNNPDFKQWLIKSVFDVTYQRGVESTAFPLTRVKKQAHALVVERFGESPVWASAIDALFDRMGSTELSQLGLADLASIEEERKMSVTNILFPLLNLLSANDVGLLKREFVSSTGPDAGAALSFDEVRDRAQAATESDREDWAEGLTIRWAAPVGSVKTPGVKHGK